MIRTADEWSAMIAAGVSQARRCLDELAQLVSHAEEDGYEVGPEGEEVRTAARSFASAPPIVDPPPPAGAEWAACMDCDSTGKLRLPPAKGRAVRFETCETCHGTGGAWLGGTP